MKTILFILLFFITLPIIAKSSFLCSCLDETRGAGNHNVITFYTDSPKQCTQFGGSASSNIITLVNSLNSPRTNNAICTIAGKSYRCGYQLTKIHTYRCQLIITNT